MYPQYQIQMPAAVSSDNAITCKQYFCRQLLCKLMDILKQESKSLPPEFE